MGCVWSSPSSNRAALYQVSDDHAESVEPNSTSQTGVAKHVDARNYISNGLKGQLVLKLPGSIAGEQYVIDSCQDCDLYLLDHSAAVTVDDCCNCRIFTGPVASSIFFRDCKDCTFITTCQQFRARDCLNCKIMLFCRTKPIIESSSKLQFGCLDIAYQQFQEDLQSIPLSKFQNFWSDIYDFNDAPGNWTFLPQAASGRNILAPMPDQVTELLCDLATEVAPRTLGCMPMEVSSSQFLFVLFVKDAQAAATHFIADLTAEEDSVQTSHLMRANEAKLDAMLAASIVSYAGWEQQSVNLLQEELCVGLELELESADCSRLEGSAKLAGGLTSSSQAAAKLFCFLGLSN